MGNIFDLILTYPLFNLLIWLYDILPGSDLGFSIILITIVVKLILWPLNQTSLKSQKRLTDLQPKLNELKVTYKDDKEKLAKAMMELYAAEKVNPFSSCLPLLLQIPIFIALYSVLRKGLDPAQLVHLYPFVPKPETINTHFLGVIDLTIRSIPLAVLAGALQFVQTKMLIGKRAPAPAHGTPPAKDEEITAAMNKSMTYFMPVFTVILGLQLQAGLTLYWVVITLATIVQQYFVLRAKKKTEPTVPVQIIPPSAPTTV